MNRPCPRYEPELSAYVDGEVDEPLLDEIETHLRACEPCRAAVAQIRGVSRTLRRWDAMETRYATSTGFKNRVLAEIRAPQPIERRYAWRVAAAAACVAAGAGAGAFALVAPRLSADESVDLARIDGDLQTLKRMLEQRPAPARAEPQPSREDPAPLERVASLPPTVRVPSPDDPVAVPDPLDEQFEQRGDRRIVRSALAEHDEYNRDRGALELEQRVRSLQERHDSADVRSRTEAPQVSPLAQFLAEVEVAPTNYPAYRSSWVPLQVWPIVLHIRRSDHARPMACDDAIAQQVLTVSESGVRETVLAVNSDTKRSVLVLAGDVLAGGRQDRVAREDMIIGPGQRISIPTYTSGRERHTTYQRFTACNGVAPSHMRALFAADRALSSYGLGQANFDDVVAATGSALSTTLRRGSLDSLFFNESLGRELDVDVKQFERRLDDPSVVGFAIAAGSRLLGVEVFGDHATFVQNRSRVLRSYLMAAFVPDRVDGELPTRADVSSVVSAAAASVFRAEQQSETGATVSVFRGIGTAEGDMFGFGLLDGTHVVHAVFFTSVPQPTGPADRRSGRRPDDQGPPIETGHGGTGGTKSGDPPPDNGTETK